MEKKSKAPLIYGYAVCLVTVITFIIAVADMVNSISDLGDPLYAERNYTKAPSLASFENYKMDILSSGEKDTSFVPDDETLKSMYESARDDKIRSVKHRANRSIMVSSLLIIICIALFATHWIWIRRISKSSS